MIVSKTFYNVKCDNCGQLLDEEHWWADKEDSDNIADGNDWAIFEGGKHYCPDCYERIINNMHNNIK